MNAAERFWSNVDKNGPAVREELGPCWVWTASKSTHGYGQFWTGSEIDGSRRLNRAHRLAWRFSVGEIPAGMCVLHRCDNRTCVRIDHLWLGTVADNNRDMHAKGRGHVPDPPRGDASHMRRNPRRGEQNHSKLTEVEVREIRALAVTGVSRRALAARFGVSLPNIVAIVNRRTWKHLDEVAA